MTRRHVPTADLTPTEAAAEREMRRDPMRSMTDERLQAVASELRWYIRQYRGTVAEDEVPRLEMELQRVEREQRRRVA